MTQANDSILVTPGAGATVATHSANSKEHQVVMVAEADGHIIGTLPVYRVWMGGSAVGANQVHMDLFNATGSGGVLKIVKAAVYVDNDTAVTGTVGVEVALTRTTAVGTGGTAATNDSTTIAGPSITRHDTSSSTVNANITARLRPTGGATAGAVIAERWVFTEETNAATAIAGTVGAQFVDERYPVYVRANEGVRFVQGAVASVGTLAFEVVFEVI